jgi:hypothetical protein
VKYEFILAVNRSEDMAVTARISSHSDEIIKEFTVMTGKTKIEIIEEALDLYRYHEKMRLLKQQFKKLRSNSKAWKQEMEERKELEGTLSDGLEDA